MIYVDRSRVGKPPTLFTKGGVGKTETKKAIDFYSIATNLAKSFEGYAAYKEEDVKDHLNVLFDNKCAYCEMDYGGSPMDIEHYRPKGEIVEVDPTTYRPYTRSKKPPTLRPGYYWLAADWENLLPSCIDCNRKRTHEDKMVGNQVTGKGNYFPLASGNSRARKHTQRATLRGEQPLLLNPCNDDPAAHLHFGDEANVIADSERGRATIAILGLQREPLVRKRKRVLGLLRNSITNVKRAQARLAVDATDPDALDVFREEIKTIRAYYLDDSSPFLAMCRAVVLKELGIQ